MSSWSIIEHLDVFNDILSRVVLGGVVPMVDQLTRECPEEAFDPGIVPAIAVATPAGKKKTVFIKDTLVARGGILIPTVRMVEEPCRGSPLRQRHGARLLGQLNGDPLAQCPADHSA